MTRWPVLVALLSVVFAASVPAQTQAPLPVTVVKAGRLMIRKPARRP